jgi:ABC-type dipeptide/oligopeptide/nickel transport system permease component
MTPYLIRRLLANIAVIWLVLTMVFVSTHILPGDYAEQHIAQQFFSYNTGSN